jgi:hypothetical protein
VDENNKQQIEKQVKKNTTQQQNEHQTIPHWFTNLQQFPQLQNTTLAREYRPP